MVDFHNYVYTDRAPVIHPQELDWKDLAGHLERLRFRFGLNVIEGCSGSLVSND